MYRNWANSARKPFTYNAGLVFVKAALIHVDAFQPNEQGFPVLPKLHQIYIKELLKHSVQFILSGRAKHKLEFYRICNIYGT